MVTLRHYSLMALLGLVSACASSTGEYTEAQYEQGGSLGSVGAALEEEEECLVPTELLEHTCQHAQFGPFASVSAQVYPGFVFTDISPSHTAYNLTLPSAVSVYQGAVLYSPFTSGDYAFFTAPAATVTVFDSAGNPATLEREGLTDPAVCGAIEKASVFHLELFETYTVVYGPQAQLGVQAMVEYLGEEGCETCAHVHLDAYRSSHPPVNDPAEVALEEPIAFEVPDAISVEEGQARKGKLTLEFANPGQHVKCIYKADQSLNAFTFHRCTRGVDVGDDVTASEFWLEISRDAVKRGPIGVELEFEDEACHGHEHEE